MSARESAQAYIKAPCAHKGESREEANAACHIIATSMITKRKPPATLHQAVCNAMVGLLHFQAAAGRSCDDAKQSKLAAAWHEGSLYYVRTALHDWGKALRLMSVLRAVG